MRISFIQFLRPDGRPRMVEIDLADPTGGLAIAVARLREAGWSFEIEHLASGEVSADICDDERQLAFDVVPNGPSVPPMIARLVRLAFDNWMAMNGPKAAGDRFRAAQRRMLQEQTGV